MQRVLSEWCRPTYFKENSLEAFQPCLRDPTVGHLKRPYHFNVAYMVAHRLRRWTNNKTTLGLLCLSGIHTIKVCPPRTHDSLN